MLIAIGAWLTSCENNSPNPGMQSHLRKMSPSEQELVQTSNDFALHLLRVTDDLSGSDNVFISPLSVGMALGMLYNGAEGTTKEEIETTLGFSGFEPTELNKTFNELMSLLLLIDDKVDITIANSVWYSNRYTIKDEFRNRVMAYFDAEVKGLDFRKESAVSAINKWVDARTLGKIPVLVRQIPPGAVMYLINAMHFKALWKQPFAPDQTRRSPFQTPDGEVMAEMMSGKNMSMLHYLDKEVEMVELPYGNGQFCLTIFMPSENPGNFLRNFHTEDLNRYLARADTISMDVRMPKFSLDFEMELNEVLKTMGLKRAFTNDAELGGLFMQKLSVKVSEVLHKAVIDVDENGTRAAAATSIGIELTSMPMRVNLNRPFIFMVREHHTKAILFSGILRNPAR